MRPGFKIAVGGKGGVGKTTVCAGWAQLLARDGYDVLAIDADPDANLCGAFGLTVEQSPVPLMHMKDLISERMGTGKEAVGAYFRMNPEVADLPAQHWREVGGVKVLVVGAAKKGGAGCACAEGAFLRAMISHTVLQRDEVVMVDLDAGLECMGRASIRGVDALVVVVEPGQRSIETALNIARMGRDVGVQRLGVVLNKITDQAQVEVIQSKLPGIPVLGVLSYNGAIQQAELVGKSVFATDSALITELEQAKERLTELLDAPVVSCET